MKENTKHWLPNKIQKLNNQTLSSLSFFEVGSCPGPQTLTKSPCLKSLVLTEDLCLLTIIFSFSISFLLFSRVCKHSAHSRHKPINDELTNDGISPCCFINRRFSKIQNNSQQMSSIYFHTSISGAQSTGWLSEIRTFQTQNSCLLTAVEMKP
jgi:hypothetical protein